MRTGHDVRSALRAETGVGRYLLGLLPALAARGVTVRALSSSLRDRFDPTLLPGCTVIDRRLPARLLEYCWSRGRGPSFELLAGEVDVCHSPTPIPLPTRSAARVVTVHDLFFLDDPAAVSPEVREGWIPRLEGALDRADAIICVSHATADRLRARYPRTTPRVHVIHHGLDADWEGVADDPTPAIEPPYLLAVGTIEPRKNYVRLLSAFDRLRRGGDKRLRLVIVGPDGADTVAVRAMQQRLGLGDAVIFTGHQPRRSLRALYRHATAFCLPSLDEGFGLPLLEAMASGVPIIAADRGAIPEIVGPAACYVDAADEESIFEGLHAVRSDHRLRERLVSAGHIRVRGFDWSETARKTEAAYHFAIGNRR